MVVIDDCQRLDSNQELRHRLPIIAERLQETAVRLDVALFAVWPALGESEEPAAWVERVPRADVMLVMENDGQRTAKLTEPVRAVYLHVAKNREGERGALRFDFYPGLAKFAEVDQA
jgi:hypothetical protein